MQLRIIMFAIATSVSAWTACTPDEAPSVPTTVADFFEEEDFIDIEQVEAGSTPALVLAEIVTRDGATITFINEGEPGGEPAIGVEIVNATSTPLVDAMLAQHPSALELFLAAAAGAEPPGELMRDHERLAAGSADYSSTPRTLLLPRQQETSGYYDCGDSDAWAADFARWAPSLAGEYIKTREQGSRSGYVGYAYKFYFDVCRPWNVAPTFTYYTGVFRRTDVNNEWVRINIKTDALNYQQRRWRYFRNTGVCSSFQYRLQVSSANGFYHRAARWSEEWRCQSTI